jgi:hypothetical protein
MSDLIYAEDWLPSKQLKSEIAKPKTFKEHMSESKIKEEKYSSKEIDGKFFVINSKGDEIAGPYTKEDFTKEQAQQFSKDSEIKEGIRSLVQCSCYWSGSNSFSINYPGGHHVFNGNPDEFGRFLSQVRAKDASLPKSQRNISYKQMVQNIVDGKDPVIYIWSSFLNSLKDNNQFQPNKFAVTNEPYKVGVNEGVIGTFGAIKVTKVDSEKHEGEIEVYNSKTLQKKYFSNEDKALEYAENKAMTLGYIKEHTFKMKQKMEKDFDNFIEKW